MTKINKQKLKNSFYSASKGFFNAFPVLIGVVFIASFLNAAIPDSFYQSLFNKNIFLDSFIGAGIGSVLAGNPMMSYVLGGELLNQGVAFIAVTAFLVAWVTVGVVQLPAEISLLGKRFAIIKTALNFVFSIIVALVTVGILSLLGGL